MDKYHLTSPPRQQDMLDPTLTPGAVGSSSSSSEKEKLSSKMFHTFKKRPASPRPSLTTESTSPRHIAVTSSDKMGVKANSSGYSQGRGLDNLDGLEASHRSGGEQEGSEASDLSEDLASNFASESSTTRRQDLITRLKSKIEHVNKMIIHEQAMKEENVNEYLRLSSNTDKAAQAQRIKVVFEKRNHQATQTIAHLSKKLESYQKKLTQVEQAGAPHKHNVLKGMGQGLKDMGSNIKEGISGFSGGVVENIKGAKDSLTSKPKEIAHRIANKKNFGSAENVSPSKSLAEGQGTEDKASVSVRGVIRPRRSSLGADSLPSPGKSPVEAVLRDKSGVGHDKTADEDNVSLPDSESGPLNLPSLSPPHISYHDFEQIRHEMERVTQNNEMTLIAHLDQNRHEMEDMNQMLRQALDEERYRCERLEEQLNDLTELHQHEVANLKQELQAMEEKMEYQLIERTRDIQEMLDSCQTRVNKMELQQQQQQIISMETFENSSLRNILTKLINVVLALLAVILVLASSVVNIAAPFLSTKMRVVFTILLILLTVGAWTNWAVIHEYMTTKSPYLPSIFPKD